MSEQVKSWLENVLVFDNQKLLDIGVLPFVLLLLVSLAASVFISYLYLQFYSSRATGSQVYRAFPLLGMSITAIFVCIQFSLPLSLGLLGALSIVRFRTPIKEPEEIGFIMLLIASSLACATFNLVFLVIILVVALAALLLRRYAPTALKGSLHDGSLILALPEASYTTKRAELFEYLQAELPRSSVDSVSQNEEEVVVAMSFKAIPPGGLAGFETGLRKLVEPTTFTVLYNRPGTL